MAQSFSTNTGLSALPEYDQQKDPAVYAELLRIRNAIQVLQGAIDGLGGAGGAVVTHSTGNLQAGRVVVAANNAGDITNISDGGALVNYVLSWVAAGTPPVWKAATSFQSSFIRGNLAGNIALSSTTYVTVLSASIPAVVGQVIKMTFNATLQAATSAGTSYIFFDFFANGINLNLEHYVGLLGASAGTQVSDISPVSIRTVQSGDLSAGVFNCAVKYILISGPSTGAILNTGSIAPLLILEIIG